MGGGCCGGGEDNGTSFLDGSLKQFHPFVLAVYAHVSRLRLGLSLQRHMGLDEVYGIL
jgi:hypothetical protein